MSPASISPVSTAPVLITGGAGFIGCNLAARLVAHGHHVRVYDNLSRAGTEDNLAWLVRSFPGHVEHVRGDVCDRAELRAALSGAQAVFHLAAQVAVTTSLDDPLHDFEVNARGTLELLEALRKHARPIPMVYTSTNKVYGALHDVSLREHAARWQPRTMARATGVPEARPLSCCSPYGCSKGAADQYVTDYARTFGLRAAVFRMSCIYGPHQRGTEDQGWVAHFLRQAIAGRPITIYGDGKQVRDLLFVDDLVDAFLRAWSHIDSIAGRAFNIGGGRANTSSLLELLATITALHGERPDVTFREWRTADQRYYVSDTRAFTRATKWKARTPVRKGVRLLYEWLMREHGTERALPAIEARSYPMHAGATRHA